MTVTNKQILPALHNSGKVKEPDLQDIGERNYTSTILKYANLSIKFPQLETDAKTVVPAINECRVIPNVDGDDGAPLHNLKIKDTIYSINSGITMHPVTGILRRDYWSDTNTQAVSVSGVTSSSVIFVSPNENPTDYDKYCKYGIRAISQSADIVIFQCNSVPNSDISVNIVYFI